MELNLWQILCRFFFFFSSLFLFFKNFVLFWFFCSPPSCLLDDFRKELDAFSILSLARRMSGKHEFEGEKTKEEAL